MKLTSANRSDSTQLSDSPSSADTRRFRRHQRRRCRPPSPLSPTPPSTSPHSQTPDSPTPTNLTDAQDNSYSSLPPNSPSSPSSSPPSTTPIFLSIAVPLPIFHGLPGECPISHLTLFNRLFPSTNPSSLNLISRNFRITLLDDAALWYEVAVEPHPSMSWEETKSAFLHAFRPPEFADRARTELVSLGQRDGESVISYFLRMQWILKRWPEHGLPESMVRGLFVEGLREEFHDWVMGRKPETVEEAVRMAMDWEGVRGVRRGREVRCGFCEGKHVEKECEGKRRMKEEWMRRLRGEVRKEEEDEEVVGEEERLGRVVSIGSVGRRSQCQCWKHQCWKKYERSASAVTAKTVNADTAAGTLNAPE